VSGHPTATTGSSSSSAYPPFGSGGPASDLGYPQPDSPPAQAPCPCSHAATRPRPRLQWWQHAPTALPGPAKTSGLMRLRGTVQVDPSGSAHYSPHTSSHQSAQQRRPRPSQHGTDRGLLPGGLTVASTRNPSVLISRQVGANPGCPAARAMNHINSLNFGSGLGWDALLYQFAGAPLWRHQSMGRARATSWVQHRGTPR
jgi:hypothetical protein